MSPQPPLPAISIAPARAAPATGAPRKAVALISGGLDSMLAAKVMLEQGIHVEGINFYTGFCVEGHTHAIRNHEHAKPKRNNALCYCALNVLLAPSMFTGASGGV
jgi:hypothetical protein